MPTWANDISALTNPYSEMAAFSDLWVPERGDLVWTSATLLVPKCTLLINLVLAQASILLGAGEEARPLLPSRD